jgi:alpha-D-ribose 1-methylphosphonate 5-triphosphate synthase subunit PhnL
MTKTTTPASPGEPALAVERLVKRFTLHLSGPAVIEALDGVSLEVRPGECLGLTGPSGSGKSTLLRCLYGNYLATSGEITVRHLGVPTSLTSASDALTVEIRTHTIGHASQFLRVIPRVPALEVVAETLTAAGAAPAEAAKAAREALWRLNVPERLWPLPPATFSGGERQRVNLARVLVKPWPILLLDEPTASLDAANRDIVASLVIEAKRAGAAIIGVFHDLEFLARVADRTMSLAPPGAKAAAPAGEERAADAA